jgi:phosphate uptake regulator
MLPGVEIVEQTYRRIIVQSFIDPKKFPVEALLKRIQVMLTTILNNLADAVKTGRKNIIEDIERIENKIDELYFLCVRQIFIDVKTKSQGEAAPENFLTAIGDRLVVRALEEMADSVRMAAREVVLLEENTPEHIRQRVAKLIEYVQVILGKTMKAFFSLDISLANEIIETTRKEFGEHTSFSEFFSPERNEANLAVILRNIIWDMINIVRNCKIIAEVTVNRFVRTPSRLVELETS